MKYNLKSLMRKGWFLPVVIVLAALVGGGIYAAGAAIWQTAQISSSGGTLTVGNTDASNPSALLSWSIAGVTVTTGSGVIIPITFADCVAPPNSTFKTTTTLSVTNNGNTNISGWQISNLAIAGNPLGLVNGMVGSLGVSVANTPIAAGATGTVTLTLNGITPGMSAISNTYNFNGISFSLSPTGP